MCTIFSILRKLRDGAPIDVYENPATAFVAGFIGSPPMNFVSLAESLIHVALSGDGGEQVIVRVNASELAPAIGDKVDVTVDAGHFFYFDKKGQRLPAG